MIAAAWFTVLFIMVVVPSSAFSKKTLLLLSNAPDTTQSVFIKAVASKNKVYVGEVFTVEYLLYSAINVSDPQTPVKIKVGDSYLEEYPENKKKLQMLVNGKPYQVTSLKKILVIAQGVGSLTIPAIIKELKITLPPLPGDFLETEREVLKKYRSLVVIVEVLPLPAQNNQPLFSGAVGQYTVDADFKQGKNPHIVAVKIIVAGNGSFKFDVLPPALPPGVTIFDSGLIGTHELTATGARAENVLSFNIATNYRGNYVIPPVAFKYFDPEAAKFVTITTRPFKWYVPDGPAIPKSLLANNGKNAAPFLYIAAGNESADSPMVLYAALFGLSLLLFLIAGWNERLKKSREANPEFYNYKNAERNILKVIKTLKGATLDDDSFSKEITAGFIKYLNDKTYASHNDLPLLSPAGNLQPRAFPEAICLQVNAFLNGQYAARFSAEGHGRADRTEVCQRLIEIVTQIQTYKHA